MKFFQFIRIFLATLVAPIILWVLPVLQLTLHNTEYFEGHLDGGFTFYLLSIISVGLALLSFARQDNSALFKNLFYAWLIFPVFWLAYIGLMLDGARFIFYSLPILSLLAGWKIAKHKAAKTALISISALFSGLLIINVLNIGFAITQAAAKLNAEASPRQRVNLNVIEPVNTAKLPDIYHIILDEFQTEYFTVNLDKKIRKNLGGFTWFPKAYSPSGRTNLALPSVLTGVPYTYDTVLYDYIEDGFGSEKSLLHRLRTFGYTRIGFLHKIYPSGSRSRFDRTYFHRDIGLKLDRESRQQLLRTLWVYTYVPKPLMKHIIPTRQFEQLETQSLLPNDAPYASLQSFRSFLDEERSNNVAGGRYMFLHLILPHFPDVLESDCSYNLGTVTQKRAQSRCAIQVIADLAQMLRDTGRFENSLIIVHGDHGGNHLIKEDRLIKTPNNIFGLDYSWARSRALVLVKPPGQKADLPLIIDDRVTDLYDIYPTVLDALDQPEDATLIGHSLISEARAFTRPLYYHMFSKNSTIKHQVNEGPLSRYIISDGSITFDKKIEVPKWKKP